MKVAALISGGVDSAVAVHRLVEQGHNIDLFYIRIGRDDGTDGCTADEDIEMCRCIAARYRLPFEVVNLHREYWDSVMEYALRTVRAGLTPNPDVMCNRLIKFGVFEQRWGHLYDKTATGHYARVIERDGRYRLATAPDAVKDQTDFLARIDYDQLSHLMFPIGDIPKAKVREIAVEQRMPNAYRRDSQGICFLGKINYNDFLERHLGRVEGDIVELETGRRLGSHHGFWFHTIGQRKGLGLSGGPWYVVDKDVEHNIVYVSQGYETVRQYGRSLPLKGMHWISGCPWSDSQLCEGVDVCFKNRHMPEFLHGRLVASDTQNGCTLESDTDVQGIAPGQYAVIYDTRHEICLGSGEISVMHSHDIEHIA